MPRQWTQPSTQPRVVRALTQAEDLQAQKKRQKSSRTKALVRTLINLLKAEKSEARRRRIVAIILMLGYEVERTTAKKRKSYTVKLQKKRRVIDIVTAQNHRPPPQGTGASWLDPRVLAALTFYMCWRFRRDESPALEFLSKDTVLLICEQILGRLVTDYV